MCVDTVVVYSMLVPLYCRPVLSARYALLADVGPSVVRPSSDVRAVVISQKLSTTDL